MLGTESWSSRDLRKRRVKTVGVVNIVALVAQDHTGSIFKTATEVAECCLSGVVSGSCCLRIFDRNRAVGNLIHLMTHPIPISTA